MLTRSATWELRLKSNFQDLRTQAAKCCGRRTLRMLLTRVRITLGLYHFSWTMEANRGKKKRRKVESLAAVDEEIAKLEAELKELEDDDESESEEDGEGLILSSLRKERIAPLPATMLPAAQCGKSRGVKKNSELLEQARRLVERASTSEKTKTPFACRLCAFVGNTLAAFEEHRQSPLHAIATKLYKEASYCKLCRVQCTSPLELERHLASKKHKERLDYLRGPGS